jgi:hypothetical protein
VAGPKTLEVAPAAAATGEDALLPGRLAKATPARVPGLLLLRMCPSQLRLLGLCLLPSLGLLPPLLLTLHGVLALLLLPLLLRLRPRPSAAAASAAVDAAAAPARGVVGAEKGPAAAAAAGAAGSDEVLGKSTDEFACCSSGKDQSPLEAVTS